MDLLRLRGPLSRRAVPVTPVDRPRLLFQTVLPSPIFGRVGTTTSFSRPAQASHTLRPVDSLPRPRLSLSQGFDTVSYPIAPPASYRANRPLPGWDSHPRDDHALRGAPESDRLTDRPEMEAPGGQISVWAGRQVDFPRRMVHPEPDRSMDRPEMMPPGGQISVCAGRQVDFPR
jgi:hypothetical protein